MDEKEGSFQKQDPLFRLEIPLGLTVPEEGAGPKEVLWRQAVPATSLATLLGGLGVLALATPAAYIAFQSGQSGENPLSLTKEYRDIIRGSWGRPQMPGLVTRLVFMLGATENVTLQEEIIAESREHGDLVQGSFLDTYRNLTYKSVMGHVWVSHFCENARYVLKTDDDIYIDMYGTHTVLERLMRSKLNQRRYNEGKLMVGIANHVYTTIIRNEEDEWNKWFVSYDEWPRDEVRFPGNSPEHFPCYIVGWFLITNPATSGRIAQAAQSFPYLYLEDVWVTGLLREEMGIKFVDLYGLRADTNEQLLATKAIQTRHTWVKTYITSISFPRVVEEYRLCHELEREARRCYQDACRSNVYTPKTNLSRQDLERERVALGLYRDERSNRTLADEFYDCAISPEYSYNFCKMAFFNYLKDYPHISLNLSI